MLTLLTTYHWRTDYGFRKALEQEPGVLPFVGSTGNPHIVQYWQREKCDYRLWELIFYMGSHTVPQTLLYFDLPADTVPFLRWCYNHVAHQELHRIPGADDSFFGGADQQINHFPLKDLYLVWQQESDEQRQARSGNVLVYLDRLTEPDGRELLRLSAPSLFE